MLAILSWRRVGNEKRKKAKERKAAELDIVLSAIIAKNIYPTHDMMPEATPENIDAVISVVLQYFRNLTSDSVTTLTDVIEAWDIETLIIEKVKTGRRGIRIQAMTVLSYMDTEPSIDVLVAQLKSKDAYIRLAAIRCLTRRRAFAHLDKITSTINTPDQKNRILLTDILQRFGTNGAWAVEKLALDASNSTIRAASLDALKLIGIESLSIPLRPFLQDFDPLVRSAAVALLPMSELDVFHTLINYLTDIDPRVRIQALDILSSFTSSAALLSIARQAGDPDWQVRYKALQSMTSMGAKGDAYLRVVSGSEGSNADIAKAVLSERLAA